MPSKRRTTVGVNEAHSVIELDSQLETVFAHERNVSTAKSRRLLTNPFPGHLQEGAWLLN